MVSTESRVRLCVGSSISDPPLTQVNGGKKKKTMKTWKSTVWLEARNLKTFFKTDIAKLYLMEIVFASVLLALVILLMAIFK